MAVTRFVLVRHGQTAANREFRYIGSRDDALTEHGHAQAEKLAEVLAVLPISAVYSSPRQRAYHTALPIAQRHTLSIEVMDDLCEENFGEWEGLSHAEVMARSEQDAALMRAWRGDSSIVPPGGESLEMMQQRVSAVVEKLLQAHPGQTIVIVSHVGPIKAVLCETLAAPVISAFRLFLEPATVSVVDWQETGPVIRLVNGHMHLGEAPWML